MERFGLSLIDTMRMRWTSLCMLFDATYEEEDAHDARGGDTGIRDATPNDYDRWA